MFSDPIKFNLETNNEKNNDTAFTIESKSVGFGRYLVQTRCPSDFAQIEIEIEPYIGESHFLLEWEVNEEEIPKEFKAGVIEGVCQASVEKKWIAGIIIQMKIKVKTGRYHPVDSKQGSFKEATKRAFEDALKRNKMIALGDR